MFLDTFEPQHRALLAAAGEVIRLEPGDVLIRFGEPGDCVYHVEHGVLRASTAAGHRLSEATEGGVVGEVAFLDGSTRSANVRARSDVVLRCWTRTDLAELFAAHPNLHDPFYAALLHVQSARFRRLTEATTLADGTESIPLESGLFVPERSAIERGEESVHLSRIECDLLVYLAAASGASVTYRALLGDVWRYNEAVKSRTVFATVHRLRTKVEIDPARPRHIVSVAGLGYRFVPLQPVDPPDVPEDPTEL